VFRIVVGELCFRKQLTPVVLLVVDEHSKILFENLIDAFSLTITLGMIGSTQVQLDTKARAECSPELRSEDRSSIRDDVLRNSVKTEDEVEHNGEVLGG
jgi:hypothetical protein